MNVGKAIYYLLANHAGTSAITTRIYPELAPQDAAAPYIVYTISNVSPDDTHDGPAVIDEVRMEIMAVADTYDGAGDLALQVRAALDRVYGTYNTVNVESIQFQDASIDVRDTPRQYGQDLTFIVRVKRDDVQIATGSPIEDVTLGRLADVDTTGATDDQVLTYDAATDSWGPEDASTVAGLDDLTDVTITTPANNQALVYNSAAGEWRNDALSLTQLEGIESELGDAIDRQALVFDEASNQWIADGVGQVVVPVRNSYRDDALTVGQVVKAVGAQGDRIKVELFDPAVDDRKTLVGVISEQIAGGQDGHAQVYGELRKIDTDDFEVGDILYPQSDGSFDTIENEYPIGIVTRSHQNTGRLFIRLWAPGKGYHQRYRTEALSEMFVGAGATVELYYTATADGDGYVTQDLTAAVGEGNVEERVLYYKAGAFGDSGTTSGYTDAGLATGATYAEMLTAFNNLLKTEGAPITIYATRTEVAGRSGLLDDYPGAAAAYSLRLLDSTYEGSAIRVRRASDNAEQDIGFDAGGDLDTTALATFCSGTDGFVKVWYDQSGNGNDATQTTTGNQPKIYDSSTGVVTNNDQPSLLFGSSAFMANTSWNGAATTYIFNVIQSNGAESSPRIGIDVGSFVEYYGLGVDGNTGASFAGITSFAQLVNGVSISTTRDVIWDALQSQALLSVSGDFSTWTGGFGFARSGAQMYSYAQEVVIYNSDQSSNRTGIEANIADYYGITLS
jgi:hypothetical protein